MGKCLQTTVRFSSLKLEIEWKEEELERHCCAILTVPNVVMILEGGLGQVEEMLEMKVALVVEIFMLQENPVLCDCIEETIRLPVGYTAVKYLMLGQK